MHAVEPAAPVPYPSDLYSSWFPAYFLTMWLEATIALGTSSQPCPICLITSVSICHAYSQNRIAGTIIIE